MANDTTAAAHQNPGEPEALKPLRDRLRATYARKQWVQKLGTSGIRLECWTTRKGNGYVVQIWDDGQFQIWAQPGKESVDVIE